MTALVVVPELDISKVERRGVLTVPSEDAAVSCNCTRNRPCRGLVPGKMPLEARALERHVLEMGTRFVERMQVRGYDLLGDLKLHGPWVSYEFNTRLADVESATWREAMTPNSDGDDDPAKAVGFVFERAFSPYSDYLLVGDFLKKNVLIEQ